ncbi:OapA N-terminal domain-containing protein [Yoonia sp.]|uniref:OapA N-terminal domain-containing protein n=1 Tax=Yoonia sp. TaxID=2212373 RepID=UPI00390C9BF0
MQNLPKRHRLLLSFLTGLAGRHCKRGGWPVSWRSKISSLSPPTTKAQCPKTAIRTKPR